jgi:hypothetical protein
LITRLAIQWSKLNKNFTQLRVVCLKTRRKTIDTKSSRRSPIDLDPSKSEKVIKSNMIIQSRFPLRKLISNMQDMLNESMFCRIIHFNIYHRHPVCDSFVQNVNACACVLACDNFVIHGHNSMIIP